MITVVKPRQVYFRNLPLLFSFPITLAIIGTFRQGKMLQKA